MSFEAAKRRALEWHRREAVLVMEQLAGLRAESWDRPLGPGKWTVAQLAEHLALTYETALDSVAGGPGMRQVLPWWKIQWLRVTVLRSILAGRSFPEGAPAPRELRPGKSAPAKREALARLGERIASAEHAIAAADRRVRFSHAYFGRLRADQILGVQAAHLAHHRRQLEAADGLSAATSTPRVLLDELERGA